MPARSAKAKKGVLKVTAPLVQVDLGNRSVQFYNGDVLPEGVSEESIDHLKSLGYVEESEAPDEGDPVTDDDNN